MTRMAARVIVLMREEELSTKHAKSAFCSYRQLHVVEGSTKLGGLIICIVLYLFLFYLFIKICRSKGWDLEDILVCVSVTGSTRVWTLLPCFSCKGKRAISLHFITHISKPHKDTYNLTSTLYLHIHTQRQLYLSSVHLFACLLEEVWALAWCWGEAKIKHTKIFYFSLLLPPSLASTYTTFRITDITHTQRERERAKGQSVSFL